MDEFNREDQNIENQNAEGQNEENEQLERTEKEVKKEKHKVTRRNITIIGLIVIIIILLLSRCQGGESLNDIITERMNFLGIGVDKNAEETVIQNKDELVEELNKKLEAGYMTLSINTSPTFNTQGETFNVNIMNLEENNYPQMFELYTVDENGNKSEMIHRTGMIPIGKTLNKLTLNEPLPAGEHKLIALCYGVNAGTGEPVGMVQTILQAEVK